MKYLKFSILLILLGFSLAAESKSLRLKLPPETWKKITHFDSQANYQLKNDEDVQVSLIWNPAKTRDTDMLRDLYSAKMVKIIVKNKIKTLKEDGYSNWRVSKKLYGKLSFTLFGTYKDAQRNTHYFAEKHFHYSRYSIRFIINSKHKISSKTLEKYVRQITRSFK